MKKLLFTSTLLCAALVSQAHAGGPASKTFGGLKAGQKFNFVVRDMTSSQSVGKKTVHPKVPVPSGLPKFKVGETVKFTIGSNGQLNGPGFSIPFLDTTSSINSYANLPNLNALSPKGATVVKNAAGSPAGATLIFYKYRIPGSTLNSLTINQVSYVLK